MMMLPPPGCVYDWPVPYFAASQSSGFFGQSPLLIDLPVNRRAGDVCAISIVISQPNRTVTPNEGFSTLWYVPASYPDETCSYQFLKVLDGTEPDTLSWANDFGSNHGVSISVSLVRGSSGNHEFDTALYNNNPSLINAPPLTLVGPARPGWRVYLCGAQTRDGIVTYTNDLPQARTTFRENQGAPDVSSAHAGAVLLSDTFDGGGFLQSANFDCVASKVGVW